MSLSFTWGTKPKERFLAFPCDRFIEHFDVAYYRGITIQAPPEVIFRWLCQLRVAPYSYDWIDNFGHKSPRTLTLSTNELVIGQRVMTGFELVDFEYNRHLTIRQQQNTSNRVEYTMARIFGDITASYLIVPQTPNNCRLLVKLVVRYPKSAIGRFMRVVLPWGDMIMMRRQLLNFKKLSEQTRSSEYHGFVEEGKKKISQG